jgi:hypothetical protein
MSSATRGEVRPVPLEERIGAFVQLGRLFGLFGTGQPWPGHSCGLSEVEYASFEEAVLRAKSRNGWFTEENVRHMLRSLSGMLEPTSLNAWLANYEIGDQRTDHGGPRPSPGILTVGLVTAGNIPLVGFHDLLCVLLSGHRARLKVSSDDAGLTAAVLELLRLIAPDLAALVSIAEQKLGEVDAVIATGSNNTARYFEPYFGHLPRIIRKNRTSVAVLDGTETEQELEALGEDLFRYFGLGCRNVGKLYIPQDFDLDRVFKAIFPWQRIGNHHKWANNYDYHKAIWLMDRVPLLENGFVLFREDVGLHSPLGSIYYERYDDRSAVDALLLEHGEQIQCIVGHGHLALGSAQCPGPQDYADGVDTMKFLLGLS